MNGRERRKRVFGGEEEDIGGVRGEGGPSGWSWSRSWRERDRQKNQKLPSACFCYLGNGKG